MSDASRLSELERDVRLILEWMLDRSAFDGCEALKQQAVSVRVTGGPITMLDLEPDSSAPLSVVADGPIPSSVVVLDDSGHSIGELLVWVEAGALSALEYAWWSDDPPLCMPKRENLRIA